MFFLTPDSYNQIRAVPLPADGMAQIINSKNDTKTQVKIKMILF